MTDRLTPLEIASGIVSGELSPLACESAQLVHEPLGALEAAVSEAVADPPCMVSFSGGFDSSVVLAAAARVARREGLPLPVPITWRFRSAPRSDETAWQERVVRELELPDWERLHGDDQLDLIGPWAMAALRRHGVIHPANAFLHLPLFERAAGGVFLTGVGGDQLLGGWRWRLLADARARRRALGIRDFGRAALALAPEATRTQHELKTVVRSPWLRPEAERVVRNQRARERAREPSRWDQRTAWQARRRDLVLGVESLKLLANDAGTRLVFPLLDPRWVGAVARAGGRDGFGTRRDALDALLTEVVPVALRDRRRKALFTEVFWTGRARELAERWDGSGVDERIVDHEAVRDAWLTERPPTRTAHLLRQAALHVEFTH